MKIADFIIDSRIGALDRTLGFLFGAARGVLLMVVAMLCFNALVQGDQPGWVANAKSKPFLDQMGSELMKLLPADPEAQFEKLKNQVKPSDQGNQQPQEAPVPDDAPAQN